MGKFFKPEVKTKLTKISDSVVSLPSGSFLKLGGQAYPITNTLLADINVVGLGGVENGVKPTDGILFAFAVFNSGTIELILSANNTFTDLPSSFVGFVQMNNDIVFDSYKFNVDFISSESTNYTPVWGNFFATGPNGFYRRVGDFIEGTATFESCSPTGSLGNLEMPTNLKVDGSKLERSEITAGTGAFVGSTITNQSTSGPRTSVLANALGDNQRLFFTIQDNNPGNGHFPIGASSVCGVGSILTASFKVPVLGWIDNLQDLLG